jgi:hypothetical protein
MRSALPSSSIAYDPNWFLSTIAQSTAALVAIVGGFLISRLISTVTEKSNYLHSLAELEGRKEIVMADLEQVHRTILDRTQQLFRESHLKEIIEKRGDLDTFEMVRTFDVTGGELSDISQYVLTLKDLVKSAYANLEEKYPKPANPPDDWSKLRYEGIRIESSHDGDIYGRVAVEIAIQRDRQSAKTNSFLVSNSESPSIPTTPLDTPKIDLERQDTQIGKRSDLRSALNLIDSEISLIQIKLPSVTNPVRLQQGFGVLAYFGIVGIIYPLYIMTKNPVTAVASVRNRVLIGFVSGFIALLIFIWKALVDLKVITNPNKKPHHLRLSWPHSRGPLVPPQTSNDEKVQPNASNPAW